MDSVNSIRPPAAGTRPPRPTDLPPSTGDSEVLRATLHVPTGEGRFLQIRKLNVRNGNHLRTPDNGELLVEHAGKTDYLTRATVTGEIVYRRPLQEESVDRLAASVDRSRAYLSSRYHIVAFDPEHGTPRGEHKFDEPRYGTKFTPQADGSVVILDGKSIVFTDPDLQAQRRVDFPWEVRAWKPLPGGGLLAQGPSDYYHLGELQIRSADGRTTYESRQVRPAATAVLPNGRLQVLEYDERHAMSLVTIDPERGEVGRVDAPTSGRGIFALANGNTVVYSRDFDEISSAFTLHDAAGAPVKTFTFERAGRPRNFLLDEAREQAYVVIQSNSETMVHRLDLRPTGDATPVEIARAPHNLVVLPVFEDGRLAVAGPKGVTVYGPQGSETFPTLQAFRAAVGEPPLQLNRVLGDTPYEDRAGIDQWLPVVARNLPIADRGEYLEQKATVGDPKIGPDRCLDFPREVSGAEALAAMKIGDEAVYQAMVMGKRPGATGEMAFPDGAGRLQIEQKKVVWTLPGQTEPTENKSFDVRGALPVKAGGSYFIALREDARGTGRVVSWCDPQEQTFDRFDVTQPVTGLYGGDAVYAVGAHGAVLMLEPPLAEGETLQTSVPLPRSLAEASAAEGGRITQNEETVVIGGIVLRRRTSAG